MEKIDIIKEELKQILSEKRYIHSIGVMEMAMELAQIYNIDIETAQIAGLLHDNAKEMTDDEMLQYAKENNIQISETEKNSVKLLHGKIGADIAKKKYGVSEEIAKAIEYHTTTNPNMDTLAKIIYVSDKIELNRKTEKYDIEAERKLAKEDFCLPELIREVETIAQMRADEECITIRFMDDPYSIPYPNLKATALHVKQIFLTLNTNSIKYNRKNGSVD